ncbi:hypothetical protein BGZ49_004213 [Haplosporangium sp. Z 27]|nr:hypothetical protein BGZ49_004213 [Haplosporangium sp. Z 27]
MSTNPDPARASSPPVSRESSTTLFPVTPAHHQVQDHAALPLHRLEISSTHRAGEDNLSHAYNPASIYQSDIADQRTNLDPFIKDLPVNDNNTYTGRPVLDTSRRYSVGHLYNPQAGTLSTPTTPSLASRRQSKTDKKTLTLAPTPESTSAEQPTRSIKHSTSALHTFAPDLSIVQDPDLHSSSASLTSVPHSPAYSVTSFSGIIPSSNSISSIASTGHSKPPVLEYKHPISVKEFDSIHILGPNHQAAIKTLCSSRVLSRIDTIGWYSILGVQKFPTVVSSQDEYDIEMATTCMAIEFGANNTETQNFNTLVLQLLSQIKLIKDQDYKGDIPSHAYNALFLTRIFLNHFISHLTHAEMVSFFEGSALSAEAQQEALGVVSFKGCKLGVDQSFVTDPRPYAEQLIQSVIGVILNLDAGSSSSAYEFYQETLNLIIVMASTQLQQPTSEISEKNYFLNMILQNFGAYSYLFTKTGSSLASEAHPIADRSVLVLLLLHSQAKGNPDWEAFKISIQNIRDERGSMADDTKDHSIFISFRKIFHVICQQIHCEEVCLLLHVLLVENTYFRTYVLSRTDPETLYLPILRMVYEGVEGKTNYSQVYVLLVILLLFSQDDVFNDSIQKITMTYQPWFTERLLKSISLGGLAVAIIIRTIQYNLAQHKDVYFHTNSLAILANMSCSLQDIHPYVSQRLVTLFDIVARRYQKLVNKQMQVDENIDKNPDVIIYGDMVILVLEIINSTLTHKLKANPQLVYSLLHKQEMFAYFREDLKFKDLINNIEQAVNYFQQKVSEANIKAPTPEEVAHVIQMASRTWPPNLMKTFPDIKFEYEEEEQSNEFFCPYVWSLLYRNTFVYWDEEKAKILHDYREVMNDEAAFEGIPTGTQAPHP